MKARLKPKRFEHSVRVAETAARLATFFQVRSQDAYIAGLMHDYAKNLSNDALFALAKSHGLLDDPTMGAQPALLHAPVGAVLLEEDCLIHDPVILDAIARHTIGGVDLSPLAKLIYLADYIEPGRITPGVEPLRMLAQTAPDEALLGAVNQTIAYLLQKGWYIHPTTIRMRNALLLQQKK